MKITNKHIRLRVCSLLAMLCATFTVMAEEPSGTQLNSVTIVMRRDSMIAVADVRNLKLKFDSLSDTTGLSLRGQLVDKKTGARAPGEISLVTDSGQETQIVVDPDGGWAVLDAGELGDGTYLKIADNLKIQCYVDISHPAGLEFNYRDVADRFESASRAQRAISSGVESLFAPKPNSLIFDFGARSAAPLTFERKGEHIRPPDSHGYVGLEFSAEMLSSNPKLTLSEPVHRIFVAYVNSKYYERNP